MARAGRRCDLHRSTNFAVTGLDNCDPASLSPAPLRLRLSGSALADNWRWLAAQSAGAACGAAVKADGYGLGAREVVSRLRSVGCANFFVATWAEAEHLAPVIGDANLSVLHGLRAADVEVAARSSARPVLNSVEQVARWRAIGGGLCDVMVDTGMNRLGLTLAEACSGLLDGLSIDTLMSHLACADEDVAMNREQLHRFHAVAGGIACARRSIANSAGICLGPEFALDLTRPGLALYGGIPRAEAKGQIVQVAFPEAEVLQVRRVPQGERVGYNATWTAKHDTTVAILNIGYADGYMRGFSDTGEFDFAGACLAVIGRVSMDLVAVEVPDACDIVEGDRATAMFDLACACGASGLSQYELLTALGQRYMREWG